VLTKTLLVPNFCKILNQYSNNGRLRIGIKHFGQMSVNGFSLTPNPAANNKAFNYLTNINQ